MPKEIIFVKTIEKSTIEAATNCSLSQTKIQAVLRHRLTMKKKLYQGLITSGQRYNLPKFDPLSKENRSVTYKQNVQMSWSAFKIVKSVMVKLTKSNSNSNPNVDETPNC